MLPELYIPAFARLDEYAGVWAMRRVDFELNWAMVAGMDLRAHILDTPARPVVAEVQYQKVRGQQVAILPVLGTMMKQKSSMGGTSTIQLRRDLRQAAADPGVNAILFAAETPGGTVAGIHDLTADVQAARKQKPVWTHADDLLASAGYWLGSSTERITANAPTALIGSIGTLLTVYDFSAQAEKEGVKALAFSTGPLKGAGVPGTRITEEQAAHYQAIVDGMQIEFDAAVQKGRRFNAKKLAEVRTGAVWKGTTAQGLGLIDAVQPLQKTLEELARETSSTGKGAVMSWPTNSQFPMMASGRKMSLPMKESTP